MNDYVMFVVKNKVVPDNNMGYYQEFIEAWGLTLRSISVKIIWSFITAREREADPQKM